MGCMERSVPKEVATDSPNPSRKRSLYIYIYGFTETLCPVRARYGFPVVPQVQSSDSSCIYEHFFLCFFKMPVYTVQYTLFSLRLFFYYIKKLQPILTTYRRCSDSLHSQTTTGRMRDMHQFFWTIASQCRRASRPAL